MQTVPYGEAIMGRTALAVALLAFSMIGAGASCYRPDAPTCVSQYGTFGDENEYKRCKREMEGYRSQVELFKSCQRKEIGIAVSEYNEAAESFNRRARGY